MTEFFPAFSTFYDNMFMSVPTVKTIIFLVTLSCILYINQTLLGRGDMRSFQIGLIILGLFLLFIPMMPNSAMKVWLYYTSNQVFTLVLSLYGIYIHRKYPEDFQTAADRPHYIWLILCAILSVAIVIEDTFVIFFRDTYTALEVDIQNRSFAQDLFNIVICVYTVVLFYQEFKEFLNTTVTAGIIDSSATSRIPSVNAEAPVTDTERYFKFHLFCKDYQFTAREQDILALLLLNKTNQEISEELTISIGTTKTHVHNIFQKIDVSRRLQLLEVYRKYKPSELTEQ